MGILINRDTRVICQGITGAQGSFHTARAISYGTRIVGGVTPGKGGTTHLGVPVFHSVNEARRETNADSSVIYVPAPFAADAILEAVDAGIRLIVCITEGIPVHDMVLVSNMIRKSNSILVGPNCPGVITPDECKIGIMPGNIHRKGCCGIVSRSGTLTYEAVSLTTDVGIGQSSCVGIGGDPVKGIDFVDTLEMFFNDDETKVIVMIGEIGGSSEEEAAEYIRDRRKYGNNKSVFAFVAGRNAPEGSRMGHAGAVVYGNQGRADAKIEKLRSCGVIVCDSITNIGRDIVSHLHD